MNLSNGQYRSNSRPLCLPRYDYHRSKKQKVAAKKQNGKVNWYTDADLAAEMNALSFEERHQMEEDIHGVADMIEETETFIREKMDEMWAALDVMSETKKVAWDRAVFLRPSFAKDRSLHLMFLRAARFDIQRAAEALVMRFEWKKRLFGDDLLIHRITWQDLTPEDQAMVKSGFYHLIMDHDRTGRCTLYSRLCLWDVSNPKTFLRCAHYVVDAFQDHPEIQRKGAVSIGDVRGSWKSSFLQVIKVIGDAKEGIDRLPYHNASGHMLYDDPAADTFIKGIRAVMDPGHRMRHRFHIGSNLEIDYSLRAFGIDVSDCLDVESSTGPMSTAGIEEDIRRREEIDEEWRRSEAPYRDPSSRQALFPNPQDIILGRNKKVALAWPGNVAYHAVIAQFARQYLLVDDRESMEKTLIAVEILDIIHRGHRARFLARKETVWEVIDDLEAQRKVSQGLRDAARDIRENMLRGVSQKLR